jgi:hypothetical protein
MGYLSAQQINPLTPLTTSFSSRPVDGAGAVDLRIVYDHRVMDDGHAVRALADLEEILQTTILSELRNSSNRPAAKPLDLEPLPFVGTTLAPRR